MLGPDINAIQWKCLIRHRWLQYYYFLINARLLYLNFILEDEPWYHASIIHILRMHKGF